MPHGTYPSTVLSLNDILVGTATSTGLPTAAISLPLPFARGVRFPTGDDSREFQHVTDVVTQVQTLDLRRRTASPRESRTALPSNTHPNNVFSVALAVRSLPC